MPSGEEQRLREDIRRVVDAAWYVLGRSRFRSLKVAQVLRESQVSASWFYKRFPSKTALMRLLLEDEMRRAAARLAETIAPYDDPRDRVRAWVDAMVGIAFDEHLAPRARMFSDPELSREFPAEVAAANVALTAGLADAIAAGVRDGVLRSADPGTDALTVYALCAQLVTDQLAGVQTLSRADAVDRAADFVFRALGARPPG